MSDRRDPQIPERHNDPKGQGCVSRLRLEQHLLDELEPETQNQLLTHCAQCTRCQARLDLLRVDNEHFGAQGDVPTRAANLWAAHQQNRLRPRFAWKVLWRPVTALSALTVALLAIGQITDGSKTEPTSASAPVQNTSRRKGGFAVSLYTQPAQSDAPGTLFTGAPLGEGDKVRFVIDNDRAGFLAILSIDGRAQVSVYHPAGERLAVLPPGQSIALDDAVQLDDAPNGEWIVAFRCDTPLAVNTLMGDLRDAVQSIGVDNPQALSARIKHSKRGCVQRHILIKKK